MLEKKIPNLIGFLILITLLAVSFWGVKNIKTFITQASPEITPQNIKIANLQDTGFTITWTTQSKTSGAVAYGLSDQDLQYPALDDRDNQNRIDQYSTHHITLKQLKPSSLYQFTILTNGVEIKNNGQPFKQETAPVALSSPLPPDAAFGQIIDSTGSPVNDALVYLTLPNGNLLSSPVNQSGSFLITLNTARTADNLNFLVYPENGALEQIHVEAGSLGQATGSCQTGLDSPIPNIILNQTINCQPSSSPPSQSLQSSQPAKSGFKLDSPDNNGTTNTQPSFRGTADPGSLINIRIDSPEIITAQILVKPDGTWSWTPPQNLSPGQHTVTLTLVDQEGNARIIKRAFTVVSGQPILPITSGEQIASPSGQPTPNPPVITPAPTPILTSTPAPTLPPSGNSTYSLALLTITGLLITLSLMTRFRFTALIFSFLVLTAAPVHAAGFNLTGLTSAAPKAAFFLILVILGVIIFEFKILADKKKKSETPSTSTGPPTSQTPTIEKNKINKKTVAVFSLVAFLAASIPLTVVFILPQIQKAKSQAEGERGYWKDVTKASDSQCENADNSSGGPPPVGSCEIGATHTYITCHVGRGSGIELGCDKGGPPEHPQEYWCTHHKYICETRTEPPTPPPYNSPTPTPTLAPASSPTPRPTNPPEATPTPTETPIVSPTPSPPACPIDRLTVTATCQ